MAFNYGAVTNLASAGGLNPVLCWVSKRNRSSHIVLGIMIVVAIGVVVPVVEVVEPLGF